MGKMHLSAERLYLAAKQLRDVNGPSAVARLMEESPQTLKNWEARGISHSGALTAQKKIGCNALWLLNESSNMTLTVWPPTTSQHKVEEHPARPYLEAISAAVTTIPVHSIAQALALLRRAIADSPNKGSKSLLGALSSLGEDPDNPVHLQILETLLTKPPPDEANRGIA